MKGKEAWMNILKLAIERFPNSFTADEAQSVCSDRQNASYLCWCHFKEGHLTGENDGDGPFALAPEWKARAEAAVTKAAA